MIQECEYGCKKADGEDLVIDLTSPDFSTYDEYSARYELAKIKKELVSYFSQEQAFASFETIAGWQELKPIPTTLLRGLLHELVLDPDFIIQSVHGPGRLVYRNGYYLFQPLRIKRESIPIAVRLSTIPLPRDRYSPEEVAEEAKAVKGDTASLWDSVLQWKDLILTSSAPSWDAMTKTRYEHLPPDVYAALQNMKSSNLPELVERLEMITFIYSQIKDDQKTCEQFVIVMLQYIWDEFLTFETKRDILLKGFNDPLVQTVAKESFMTYNNKLYLRILNESTFNLEYFCKGAKGVYEACGVTLSETLALQADPLLATPLTIATTGDEDGNYGFLSFIPST